MESSPLHLLHSDHIVVVKVSLPELHRAGETSSGNRNVIGPIVPMCSEPLKPGVSTLHQEKSGREKQNSDIFGGGDAQNRHLNPEH